MWEILAAQDLWSELSSNVSYYCMNELRGWNGSLIEEIKHTCNHSRSRTSAGPSSTRVWFCCNSIIMNYNKIHGLEISLQLLKSTRVNPEFMREKNHRRDTAPQRKISFLPEHRRRQNKKTHGLLARAFCSTNRRRTIALSTVFMDENCSSCRSGKGQTPRIHPSIHPSIHHRVNRCEDY